MNDQAVYRTAPATQGLFNICDPSGQSFNQGRFFSQALLINTLQHCPFPGHTQGLLHGALDPGALCGGRGWMGSQVPASLWRGGREGQASPLFPSAPSLSPHLLLAPLQGPAPWPPAGPHVTPIHTPAGSTPSSCWPGTCLRQCSSGP